MILMLFLVLPFKFIRLPFFLFLPTFLDYLFGSNSSTHTYNTYIYRNVS